MVISEYGVTIEKWASDPLKPLNKVLGVKCPFFHVQGVCFLNQHVGSDIIHHLAE